MTCLATHRILFKFEQINCIFASSHIFEFVLNTLVCILYIPVRFRALNRATMDRHPNGWVPLSWCATAIQVSICLSAHIQVYFTLPQKIYNTEFRLRPSVTSNGVKTHLSIPTVVLIASPAGRLPVNRPFKPLLSPHFSLPGQTRERHRRH